MAQLKKRGIIVGAWGVLSFVRYLGAYQQEGAQNLYEKGSLKEVYLVLFHPE